MNNKHKRLGLFIALSALLMAVTVSSLTHKTTMVTASAAPATGFTRVWIQAKGSWIAANGATICYKAWRSSDNTYLNTSDAIGFSPMLWSLGGTVTSGSYTIPSVYYYDIDTNASMNYDTFRFLRLGSDGTTILNESANLLLSSWNNRNYKFIGTTSGNMTLGTSLWSIANFKSMTGLTSLKTCSDYDKVPDLLMAYEALDYNTQTLRDAALLASTYATEYDYVAGNDLTPNDPYGTNYNYGTNTTTINLLNKIKYIVKVYDGVHTSSLYASYWGTTATNLKENTLNTSISQPLDIMIVLVLGGLALLAFYYFETKTLEE
ncbi:MAG: hypothetical protein NTV44_04450 [Firmicutes bacterium]|nr:hypothetical protein [Bacillota bacterium]